MAKVVLITGCSTGIGRDLVQSLSQAGYSVVATARKVETLADVSAALKLPLDVTQADSVCKAVEQTVQRFGRIDILINNAGYGVQGAVEEVSVEQLHRMFDVNVYGAMRLIHAVAPLMRQQRAGRILNISSITGKLALPMNGTYAATKFALEALSDALRLELSPFGIQVVVIEPGPVKTHFADTAQTYAQEILSNPASPYRTLYNHAHQVMITMRQQECEPAIVSQVVQQAIEMAQPKARYLIGISWVNQLVFYLGDSAKDFIFKRLFKIATSTQ